MNLVSQQPTRLRRCLLKHSKHWTKFVIIETLLFGIFNALLFGIFSFFVVVANIHTRVQERSCAIATRKGDGSSFWHSTFQVEWAGSGVSDLKTLSLSCCVSRVHAWETTDEKKKQCCSRRSYSGCCVAVVVPAAAGARGRGSLLFGFDVVFVFVFRAFLFFKRWIWIQKGTSRTHFMVDFQRSKSKLIVTICIDVPVQYRLGFRHCFLTVLTF